MFEPDAVCAFAEVEELVGRARAGEHDLLDRYVEAHVHGGVSISRDVEAVWSGRLPGPDSTTLRP